MLAAFTGVSELSLDEGESEKLAKAIGAVGEHYGLATAFDPKTLAWVNLTQTVVAIYGTRIMSYRLRKMNERADRAKKAQEQPQPMQQRSTNAQPMRTNAGATIPGLGDVAVDLTQPTMPKNNFPQ